MSDLIRSEPFSSSSSLNIDQLLLENSNLNQELEQVKQEKAELKALVETITESSDVVAKELQQKVEQAKCESEERFQLIAEATPVTVIISQLASGKILYANTAASSMLDLTKEELLNRRTLDFYYEASDREKLLNIFRKHGSLRNYEVQWKKANGTNFWAVISLQSFVFNGSEALLGTVLDITKRKQAEVDRIRFTQQLKEKNAQLQRLNQLKDEFLINTSNQLSTPLEGLVNTAKSMLQGAMGEVSPPQQKSLQNLTQSGYQLLNRINNIREFSKLRHGDIKLELQLVDLHQIAETVLQSMRSLIDQKNLELVNSIPAKSTSVYADPVRLQQILQILVDNAIEFTPTGQIEISTSAIEVEDPQNSSHIAISIYDTGKGIAEDELAEISELFKQAEHLATRQAGSKGLGLSIVKALVELHKGKITVESTVGVGTRFTFTLPKNISPIPSRAIKNIQPSDLIASPPSLTTTNAVSCKTTKKTRPVQTAVATVSKTQQQNQHTRNKFVRGLSKIPLRVILIVPFVVQVVGAVGLVGYLSFKNGQEAVDNLATQLMSEITARIEQNLRTYLETPHQINQSNENAIELGLMNTQNLQPWEKYLWQQVQSYPYINFIKFTNKNGQERTGEKLENGTLLINVIDKFTNFDFYSYNTNTKGDRTTVAAIFKDFDTRRGAWYIDAGKAGKATWSSVYLSLLEPVLLISASQPVYDLTGKQLQGVLNTSLRLNSIGRFLNSLKIGKSGQAFIVEHDGTLLATSTHEQPFRTQGNIRQVFKAVDSNDPVTKTTARYLATHYPDFNQIKNSQKLNIEIENKRQYVKLMPFQDNKGLHWLIVVVVPETDFMAQINTNNQTTFVLCIATLVVAIVIGILTSRWVTEPLVRLNFAAKDIAKGEWDKTVDIERADEVGELAKTFNYMAGQLKKSFETLENQNNAIVRFFPHEYLKFLQKKSVINVQLGDHVSKEMAVMFSDIRSFTTMSESMTPQENFDFVNAYLRRVSPEIRNHNGIIVKYLGDGMMAIFPNSADDAVQAGIFKLRRVHEYNQERAEKGYAPLQVGIGIHVGHMMVGMVGEENRMQGDAFSDNVNLTARLEGLTKFYGVSILISEQVLEKLSDPSQYQIRFLDRAIVKGRKEAIAVYEVMDGETEEVKALKFQTQSDFEQGLEYYRCCQFTEAQRYFEQVLAVNLSDKTAALYLERVNQLIERGAPENWDGVWAFSEK